MMQEFISEIGKMIEESIGEIHTAVPGTIKSVNTEDGTVDVVPVMMKKLRNEKKIKYPVITDVPLVFPQGASQSVQIVFPVKPGDSCLLIISEQALDYWMFGMETDSDLPFDMTNAVCIPGLFQKFPESLAEANKSKSIIMKSGDTKVRVAPNGVFIKGNLTVDGELYLY